MQILPVDPHCRFPDDFIWGVATSSFQIEADVKGPSIWVLRLHRDWPVPPLCGNENGAAFLQRQRQQRSDAAARRSLI